MRSQHLLTAYKALLTLILITAVITLSGCASTDENARTLFDRLEFEEGERGCVDLRATVDLNPFPLLTSNASLILKKDTGEDSPQC